MTKAILALCGAAPLLTAVLFVTHPQRDGLAEETDARAQAAATWQGSCRKCHAPPDTKFETDRAFLAQITETS